MYALTTAFLAVAMAMYFSGIDASLVRDPIVPAHEVGALDHEAKRDLVMNYNRELGGPDPLTITVTTTIFVSSCPPDDAATVSAGTPVAASSTAGAITAASSITSTVAPDSFTTVSGTVIPIVPVLTAGSTGSAGPLAPSTLANSTKVTIAGSTTAPVPSIPATPSSTPVQTAGSDMAHIFAAPHVLAALVIALGMAFMA